MKQGGHVLARSKFTALNKFSLFGASCAALLLVGCPPTEETLDPDESITFGLLLPFTGSSAATASNFERATLYAAERINESGGLRGKSIRIVARDTHSNVEDSLDSVQELIDEGAVAVIGPESPEIARAISQKLNESEVAFVSPLIGAGEEVDVDCTYPWYRLAPSAQSLGENLANDLAEMGMTEIAILSGSGDYNTAFANAVRDKFQNSVLGGTVSVERSLNEAASSHSQVLREVLAEDPQAIVLSASPQTGALAFTEATLLGVGDAKWALSPLLKTPLFLQNIDTDKAEGAFGVAPKIFDASDAFPEAFSDRWLGDEPLEGAYFYYDSVGLLVVAMGLLGQDTDYTYEELSSSIVRAASSRGISVGWDEIEQGLTFIEDGTDAHYTGLTGPILLETCGERRSGLTQTWSIRSGVIVEDKQ